MSKRCNGVHGLVGACTRQARVGGSMYTVGAQMADAATRALHADAATHAPDTGAHQSAFLVCMGWRELVQHRRANG